MLQVNHKVKSRVFLDHFLTLLSVHPADSFQYEHQIMKATCHLSCTGHPCVECGINGKVMWRLEKEARAERGEEDSTAGSDRRGHT